MVDYWTNILKSKTLPDPPKFEGSALVIRFHDKNRDKFLELAKESLKQKHWTKPIVTESQKLQQH